MTSRPKITQPTAAPTRKVQAATIGGALANIALVIADRVFPGIFAGVEAEVHILVTAAATFIPAYFVRDRAA